MSLQYYFCLSVVYKSLKPNITIHIVVRSFDKDSWIPKMSFLSTFKVHKTHTHYEATIYLHSTRQYLLYIIYSDTLLNTD